MMIYRRHQKANVVVKHSSGILILLYASVKVGCRRLPGTRVIRYFETKLFFTFICALLIAFAKK